MIHIDTVKKVALLVVLLFGFWNWAVAENEVRNLTRVGSSIGEGWSQCMTVLEPKVEGLEALATHLMGLNPAADPPAVMDDPQTGDDG